MDNIEKLLHMLGVSAEYLDYSGQQRQVPRAVRERVLRIWGYDPEDPRAIGKAVYELDANPWESWLRPQYIVSAGFADGDPAAAVNMSCGPDQLKSLFYWQLHTDDGKRKSGQFRPADTPETGDYSIAGVRYSRRCLPLRELPLGYHRLTLTGPGGHKEQAEIAVCPPRCFNPVADGQKLWGISCQLYTLRSDRNFGMGDFGDLRELVRQAAAVKADFIGLNPLHAPCADSPDAASPYSPSDRRFINALYIQLDAVEDYNAPSVQAWLENAAQVKELERLRELAHIDYEAVNHLKYHCLELMFDYFCEQHLAADSLRAQQFQNFVDDKRAALQEFAAYECHHNGYPLRYGKDTRFYCYLQWLAFGQLDSCQRLARDSGMRSGLLGDLAVGSVGGGCEVKTNQHLYLTGATIGAPPDPIALNGQDWGLPVINPLAMQKSKYRHFISLLHANMKSYGALRIDHAMALMRLWWCLPAGHDSERSGVYVYYPIDDLMALLRLESVRNQCMIVGEDLGVVPAEFRQKMAASGAYSNNLLYFEQHHDQYFKPPHEHQVDALLMVTNHDVSTLCDWWDCSDLQRRFDLGLMAGNEDLEAQLDHRRGEKHKLLNWLADTGLLPANRPQGDIETAFDIALCAAIHQASSRTASKLLLLQLEDLQLMQEPVNIPGTYRQYPNWRRKQRLATSDIFASSEAKLVFQLVSEERPRDSK